MTGLRQALLVAGVFSLAACASNGTVPAPPAPPPSPPLESPAPPEAPSKGPAFEPSGVKEEYRRLRAAKEALKSAMAKDEQDAARAALEVLKADLAARWTPDRVPAPEAHYLASILHECGRPAEAVTECRRWLAVAPRDNSNYAATTKLLVLCLAESGDSEGSESEYRAAASGVLADRPKDRGDLVVVLALVAQRRGDLERALRLFEEGAFAADGDIESVLLASETAQRLGRPEDAIRIARRASEVFVLLGYFGDRVRWLVEGLALLGRPAAGFDGVSWWKGSGGPVSREDLHGRVTVVFSWNMKSAWNAFFFERLNALARDYADRGVRVVGVSRLSRFDPTRMETREELTDEDELAFYDLWSIQYEVTYPLAVYPHQSDRLFEDWAARVVPLWVVVGKDGNVSAVCSGKDEERFAALRDLVDLALAR